MSLSDLFGLGIGFLGGIFLVFLLVLKGMAEGGTLWMDVTMNMFMIGLVLGFLLGLFDVLRWS